MGETSAWQKLSAAKFSRGEICLQWECRAAKIPRGKISLDEITVNEYSYNSRHYKSHIMTEYGSGISFTSFFSNLLLEFYRANNWHVKQCVLRAHMREREGCWNTKTENKQELWVVCTYTAGKGNKPDHIKSGYTSDVQALYVWRVCLAMSTNVFSIFPSLIVLFTNRIIFNHSISQLLITNSQILTHMNYQPSQESHTTIRNYRWRFA